MSCYKEEAIDFIIELIKISDHHPMWIQYCSDDFSTARWLNPSTEMIDYVVANGKGLHCTINYEVDDNLITVFTTIDAEERCEGER